MKKVLHKISEIVSIEFWHKVNQKSYMPIVFLATFCIILSLLCSLAHLRKVWLVALIFLIFNSYISFQIGCLIDFHKLSKKWLLFFPIIFALMVTVHFAKYNYFFCLIYLCFELLGLWHNDLYQVRK
ncbi:hypothetical protein [Lactobacillus iners]|uniref:hypothetical protein n=1 Tax=Lactobacillus iners TaxID=147802 RepID=UPI0030144A56